jgi:hypothetical protein
MFEHDYYFKRTYELGVFNLASNITISNNNIFSLIAWNINKLAIKNIISDRILGKRFIVEGNPGKDLKRFSCISAPTYATGYWQNEDYFIRFKKVIKSDFEILVELSDLTKAMAQMIQAAKNPISIHVRRNHEKSSGDISENKKRLTVPLDYYLKSINIISREIDSPSFFIFSDNTQWARKNLSFISNANFIDSTDRPGFEDLYLMTRCHHHIIANSSFSWWGAWLSINESSQIVIAPKDVVYTPPIPSAWLAI